jgi:hypothetical protein
MAISYICPAITTVIPAKDFSIIDTLNFWNQLVSTGMMETALHFLAEMYPLSAPSPTGGAKVEDSGSGLDTFLLHAADVNFAVAEMTHLMFCFGTASNLVAAAVNKESGTAAALEHGLLLNTAAFRMIRSGVIEAFFVRALASFASLPNPADVHPDICTILTNFEYIIEVEGSIPLAVARIADANLDGANVLRELLGYAVA